MTELDPEATITTIDGISAFDSISRRAMLLGLDRVAGGRQALPFVRLFYSEPSAYLWEDDAGTVHTIHQGPLDATPVLLGAACIFWRRCRGGCVPQRGSWRILMTSLSRPDQREWAMSWQPAFRSCGLTPGSECMVAKPTSGTRQGRNPGCVTFCRDKH